MSKWEEESIFIDPPEELIFYRRYIDDVVLIWKGDRDHLHHFFNCLNNNDRNIKLSWQIEEDTIPFLDLEISRVK